MHDEVAHLGVVDGRLRLRLPGGVGGGVVREDADDVELREVPELGAVEVLELAAEDEVEAAACLRLWSSGHRGVRPRSARGWPLAGSSARHGLDQARMQPGGRGEELAMDRLGPVVARPRGPRRSLSRPPASARMRSAAARSQSREFEETRPRSTAPSATRTRRSASEGMRSTACNGPAVRSQPVDQRLRAGDPRAARARFEPRPRSRRRCGRRRRRGRPRREASWAGAWTIRRAPARRRRGARRRPTSRGGRRGRRGCRRSGRRSTASGAPRRAGSSAVSSESQAASGRACDEPHLEEGVDRDVGLGHRRAAVLRPDPRGRLPAAPEIAAGDPARLARHLADDGHEREGEVLSKIHDWPRG